MSTVIKKKILTEDDLLRFCEEQKFARFSSKDTGYQLAVKVPTTFEVDDNVDDNHRGMMRLKFRIFHTGLNRNKSYVSNEAAEKAMNTIADRPVLAAIHQLDDGTWDFEGHEMEVVKDENGNEETRYIESQVGSFSSEPAFWEHDDELNKDYVCAYAYISEEYTRACDIIRQKNGSKNSCELFIDELFYNAKEHYLDLINFYVNASTLLGSRDDGTKIEEGMQGSRADIADFSVENNSVKFDKNDKLVELLESLNEKLSNFNKSEQTPVQKLSKEGGNENRMFEKLLEKYGKTAEDITFDYAELSDEELEAKFAEMFEDDNSDDGESGEPSNDNEGEGDGSENNDNSDNGEGEDNQNFEKLVRTYEISHEDTRYALYNLLTSYEELDNDYYYISAVYDNYFVYEGWCTDKIYRQEYAKDGDNISFEGERIELFRELLTASEKAELESMRSNYAALKEFKETAEKNELHAKREEILANENFASISEKDEEGNFVNKDFEKLYTNMDNYSLEDLEKEVKLIYADSNMKTFATTTEKIQKKSTVKVFANVNKSKKDNRYGNLFSK